jgi:hypothetical protein
MAFDKQGVTSENVREYGTRGWRSGEYDELGTRNLERLIAEHGQRCKLDRYIKNWRVNEEQIVPEGDGGTTGEGVSSR